MDFKCTCSVGLDDFAEMIETRINKARKEHKCEECGEIIEVGERYLVEKEVFEGVFSTHKTCLPCAEIRSKYLTRGYVWGQIWSDLKDCFGDVSLSEFEKFSSLAQQKLLEML